MFKKIMSCLLRCTVIPGEMCKHSRHSFYPVSGTCQVPRLGDIYELFWGEKSDGVFVEVGAFDGEYASNTSCLADIGWKGLYIEPIASHFEECVARHAKNASTKVIHTGIASISGDKEIHSLGPLSTLDKCSYENLNNMEWSKKYASCKDTEVVSLMRLEDVLVKENIVPGFDLLVVDVEGYEVDVFKSFSLNEWKPSMMIVELHDVSPNYKQLHNDLRELYSSILACDYVVIYKDFTNTIFVKSSMYK